MSAGKAGRSKAKGRTMTPAARLKRENAIISDIKAGKLSYREIAEKHSVSLPTVNNKAKKAGISRGRRKGATILVPGPRSKGVRRGRPAGRRKVAARRSTNRAATGRRTTMRRTSATQTAGFNEAFRELVLNHFPELSLRKFDRLSRMVESEVA